MKISPTLFMKIPLETRYNLGVDFSRRTSYIRWT
jgi:hypothetical protein